MLCLIAALLYLYLSAGIHMLSTLHQASHDRAAVTTLEREHVRLVRQHEALSRPGALEAGARRLGMIKPGEQPYVVGGLPGN
jgi:cell division protein FtsB